MDVRVFLAVELSEEVRRRVAAAARELLRGVRGAKSVAEENLHVTVKFLGEVGETALAPLAEAVRESAASVGAGQAAARGFGVFPDLRRPSVVWAGVDDPDRVFVRLERAVSERLESLGRAREARPFSPHVTVARIRDRLRDPELLSARLAAAERHPPAFGAVPVTNLTVFQSELGRGGSRYTALARCPLNHP